MLWGYNVQSVTVSCYFLHSDFWAPEVALGESSITCAAFRRGLAVMALPGEGEEGPAQRGFWKQPCGLPRPFTM